jgi:hypothetical protein
VGPKKISTDLQVSMVAGLLPSCIAWISDDFDHVFTTSPMVAMDPVANRDNATGRFASSRLGTSADVMTVIIDLLEAVSVEENVFTFTLGTLGQLIGIGASAATVAPRFVP